MTNIKQDSTGAPIDYDPFAGEQILYTAPATESQQEIWGSVQMGGDANCAFNESVSLRLGGPLDIGVLRRAFLTLIGRHDALRTLFSPDGKTLCITAAPQNIEIPVIDLTVLNATEQHKELEAILANAVETPFDLQNGPLFKISVVKLGDEDQQLIFTVHHIICDGWSFGVLLPELGELYSADKNGNNLLLPDAYHFSSYARDMSAYQKSKEFTETIAFWDRQFMTIPPALDLPVDSPRPAYRTFNSRRVDITLNEALVLALKKTGGKSGCSFFVIMLAAFQAYLARISGQDNVVVGTPSAGQSVTDHDRLVGHCVNLLPIRTQVNFESSFTELMKMVKKTMLDASDHQQYTYGSLLKRRSLPRDPGRIPLVSVLFNIDQGLDVNSIKFEGLTSEFFSNPRHFENFELFINGVENAGRLVLECQYNTHIFTLETIRRRLDEFKTFLEGIVIDSNRPITTLPLLGNEELKRILIEFNNTKSVYPQDIGVHHLVEKQAKTTPDRIAVAYRDQKMSYFELEQQANRIAHYLKKAGVVPGALVGIALSRSSRMITAVLAILKTGAAYVPLDPSFPPDRLSYMLTDAKIGLLVTEASVAPNLPSTGARIVSLDGDAEAIATCSADALPAEGFNPEMAAYVIYTSGSTGKPKGVQVPHRAVVNFLLSMQHEPGLHQDDILIAVTTLSFDIAVLEIFLPLVVGARTIIADRDVAYDGNELKKAIETNGATVMQATPATWRMLLAAGWKLTSPFKILCGGESLSPDLAADLHATGSELWNMYGPTETTVWSTCHRISGSEKRILIGRPIANTQIYILDPNLQPVPMGVPGELYIAGDGVTLGYLNRPELTQLNFLPDPFGTDGQHLMYKTGDMARFQADGIVECLGRIDNQVKVRGFRIELGEIEAVLNNFDRIEQCAVATFEFEQGDLRLVAYMVLKPGVSADAADIRNYLHTLLPDYMIPQHFVTMNELPRTPNGKIDRKQLPPPAVDTHNRLKVKRPPRSDIEKMLAEIWTDVLKIPDLDIDDNFFEIGGHSLLVMKCVVRIRKELGIELAMHHFFEMPTIARLAVHAEAILNIRNATAPGDTGTDDREEIEI